MVALLTVKKMTSHKIWNTINENESKKPKWIPKNTPISIRISTPPIKTQIKGFNDKPQDVYIVETLEIGLCYVTPIDALKIARKIEFVSTANTGQDFITFEKV